MTEVDFNALEARTKPRDLAWENWKKWNQVGEVVQGFIVDVFFRAEEGDFSNQRGLTIKQADGELINVGIKHLDFILNKTNDLRLNDPVKIVFEAELPAKQKHHSPTKQFAFFGTNLPENVGNKTVLELENEDRVAVEALAAAEDAKKEAEFNGDAAPVAAAPATAAPVAVAPAAAPVAPVAAPVAAAPATDLPFENPAVVAAPIAAPVAPAAAPVAPVAAPAAPVAPVAPTTPQ